MASSDVQGREAANIFDTSLFASPPYLINCSILPTVSPKQISTVLASLQLYSDHTSPVIISHLYHYHLLNLNSMLKILQVRLQQYMNRELPGVQAGFRKGRGTRDQITNIRWIIEKTIEFQKNIYFCFIDYAKAFDCADHKKTVENCERDGNTRPPDLPLEKSICRSGSNS